MSSTLGKTALVAALSALVGACASMSAAPAKQRLARLGLGEVAASVHDSAFGAVAKGADGHFWAEAEVNGQPVRFLVDTGATAVALTPEDARRLGIRTADLRYGQSVTTVGGGAHAANVTLASITINGARVDNVQALVVPEGLDVSLLGMSYLGRLTRFEATRDTLRLEP